MQLAGLAIATMLVASAGACSKANDDAEQARGADVSSGTDTASDRSLENTSAHYGRPGNAAEEASRPGESERAPSGVGMSAPGTGNTRTETQPTGPGTAGEGVTTGGPGATNSPSGASGRVNLGN